ncbi:MAG: polysaccharide deacetylase family protein [Terriglobales bacterium]
MLVSKSKRWLKKALVRSSILPAASRFFAPAAAILAYHSVVEDPQLTDYILGSSRARIHFERHIETLARKFSPVTIDDVAEFAKSGKRLPPRAVAVTFDDGFADNYEVALPILSRYGVPATFYIMVEAVENGTLPWYCRIRFAFNTTKKSSWTYAETKRTYPLGTPDERRAAMPAAWDRGAALAGRAQEEFVESVERALDIDPQAAKAKHGLMMDWEQVRSLKKAGHTIGGHTLSHPNVAQVSEGDARSEIAGCKRALEEKLGDPVDHFSYPHPALNPHWSSRTLGITREAGFKSAALTTYGSVRAGDEPLALKRMYTPADLDQFTLNLQRTFLKSSGAGAGLVQAG